MINLKTAAALIAMGAAASASAQIIVDHFDEPAGGWGQAPVTGVPISDPISSPALGSATRTVTATQQSGAFGTAYLNLGNSGEFSLGTSSTSTDITADVVYNGFGTVDLNMLGSGVGFYTLGNSGFASSSATFAVKSGISDWSSYTWAVAPGTTSDYTVNFASLAGSANLGAINEIKVTIDPGAGASMNLHAIVIPEASEYAMFGAFGLLAFGAYRRFRNA